MSLLQSILIGILEGLTEFLPVSSTGHMILATAIMGIHDSEFVKTFEIVIQLGAILAVVVLYRQRFVSGLDLYKKLIVAFLPTAIVGGLAYKFIKGYLFHPLIVTVALIIGGIILIVLDRWIENRTSRHVDLTDLTYLDAAKVGLFQCLAMIPGTSRSAAAIFGGIFAGFDRKLATEFSFLLAVPTMFAASTLDLYKSYQYLPAQNLHILLAGFIVAFVSAMVAVKAFIVWIQRKGFKHFGYYRIILGIVFLLLYYTLHIKL